jgi:Sec-independent protein translocase protein TatA
MSVFETVKLALAALGIVLIAVAAVLGADRLRAAVEKVAQKIRSRLREWKWRLLAWELRRRS